MGCDETPPLSSPPAQPSSWLCNAEIACESQLGGHINISFPLLLRWYYILITAWLRYKSEYMDWWGLEHKTRPDALGIQASYSTLLAVRCPVAGCANKRGHPLRPQHIDLASPHAHHSLKPTPAHSRPLPLPPSHRSFLGWALQQIRQRQLQLGQPRRLYSCSPPPLPPPPPASAGCSFDISTSLCSYDVTFLILSTVFICVIAVIALIQNFFNPKMSLPVELTYIQYAHGLEAKYLPAIRALISKDLSEPYSIYVYRYFLYQWGHLCFMVINFSPVFTSVLSLLCSLRAQNHECREWIPAEL